MATADIKPGIPYIYVSGEISLKPHYSPKVTISVISGPNHSFKMTPLDIKTSIFEPSFSNLNVNVIGEVILQEYPAVVAPSLVSATVCLGNRNKNY